MKTVIIEYATISPRDLISHIEKAFKCVAMFKHINNEYYELYVIGCTDLAELEDVLAEYV